MEAEEEGGEEEELWNRRNRYFYIDLHIVETYSLNVLCQNIYVGVLCCSLTEIIN